MTKTLFTIAAVAAVIAPAFATDLWDQQAGTTNGDAGFVNQVFSDFPTDSVYEMGEVNNSQAWTINSVSIIVESTNAATPSITSAVLNIFDDGTSNPAGGGSGDDPTTGQTVAVSTVLDTALGTNANGYTFYMITASGLNISMAAGSHWVGLTPNTSFSAQGEPFFTVNSLNSAGATFADNSRNPGGAFGFPSGTNWGDAGTNVAIDQNAAYGSIDLVGTIQSVPAPSAMAFLGLGIGALLIRRRK